MGFMYISPRVPKMEVLNLIRLFVGLGFPLHIQGIQALHTAYTGEYLRFRYQYLKCLVKNTNTYCIYLLCISESPIVTDLFASSYLWWVPPKKNFPFPLELKRNPWAQNMSDGMGFL